MHEPVAVVRVGSRRIPRGAAARPWGGVQPGDQLAVGRAGGLELLLAFLELAGEVGDLLLERGDAAFELLDVVALSTAI
jgi:hypothetical protein